MAKVVFYQCEKSTKTATPYAEFDTDVIGKSEYDNKCREIQAKFGAEYTRAFEVTTTPPSGIPAHQGAQTGQLNDGQTVQLVYYLVYTNANAFNLANPVQEAEYFDYLEKNGMKSKRAALADLNKNYSTTLSVAEKNNIASRYEMHLQQINAGANMGQGIGANTTGITYGEVRKATAGTKGRKGALAAIQSLRPGMSTEQAKRIWKESVRQQRKYRGTSQDYDAALVRGEDVTRFASYSYDLGENATPQKNGYSFTLGTIGQLAREATGINPRSEDFREMIAARFGVGSREAGYYQSQYLDQTPDMAKLLEDAAFQNAPENIVGYNAALQELPQRGQFDPSKVPLKRKEFDFDKDQEIWDELKKSGLAGGGVGKRAMQILQQLMRTAPGASQSYIIEQARKFDPNIGEQSFRSRFNAVRDASIERGLFADNDEAGQRIVDAHLRAQELAGKSDEEKIALYNQLEESGQISAFKPRKASLFERYNRFSGYNRKRNELNSEYDKVEAERKQAEAAYAQATSPGDQKKFKELSEQAEKKLEEINANLNRIKEGYAEWMSDPEKLKLINDQIIKTLEQTSEAIDPGTGKVKDPNYRFDADVQKTIDASGKESTIVEGAAANRRKSSVEERASEQSPALKEYLESVEKKNEARVARWSQQGAKVGSLFGTKGGNLGASLGGSAAKLVGAFSTLATGVGVVIAAGQLLAAGFRKLYGAAEEAVQKMLAISKYDGNLLAANFLHKGREFRRNQQFARETAATGTALIDSYDDFQDELQPLKIAWQKFKNTVGKWFLDVSTWLMKAVNSVMRFFGLLKRDDPEKLAAATSGRFSVPKQSETGAGGDEQANATKPGRINVETGDYTAYDDEGRIVSKKEQSLNKAVAKDLAKTLGVDLKAVQDNEEFNWRLANLQKIRQAMNEGYEQNGRTAWGLTPEQVKQANAGKNVSAVDMAAGIVDGEIKGERGLFIGRDIVKSQGNYSDGGKNLEYNERTKTIAAQAQLYKAFYDSERKTGKGIVDEEALRMLNPEGMKKNRQGTIDSFIKSAKENRQENELAIWYNETVNNPTQGGEKWAGYQTIKPEEMSESALKDMAVTTQNQSVRLDIICRRLEEILGYNRDIADNTKPKEDVDPTTDLIFGMMGRLASNPIKDPGAPQGVDMSSYSNENKQYGRFAGQRTTTYWGRPESKK